MPTKTRGANQLFYRDNLEWLPATPEDSVGWRDCVSALPRLTITVGRANGFYLARLEAETREGAATFRGRGPSIVSAVDVGLVNVRAATRQQKGRSARRVKIARELDSKLVEKRQ